MVAVRACGPDGARRIERRSRRPEGAGYSARNGGSLVCEGKRERDGRHPTTAIGSAAALMSVALALLVGRFIAKRVPLKTVQRVGALCMTGLAVWTLIEAFTG